MDDTQAFASDELFEELLFLQETIKSNAIRTADDFSMTVKFGVPQVKSSNLDQQ